jgi:hypothetical protein
MSYKCHKCEALILILRLGYCGSCREPISSEILTESKKQALAVEESEYEAMRDRVRVERSIYKGRSDSEMSFDIDFGGGDGGSWD